MEPKNKINEQHSKRVTDIDTRTNEWFTEGREMGTNDSAEILSCTFKGRGKKVQHLPAYGTASWQFSATQTCSSCSEDVSCSIPDTMTTSAILQAPNLFGDDTF